MPARSRWPGAAAPATRLSLPSAGRTGGCRFYQIAKAGSAPIAEEALRRIAGMYGIETQIRGRPPTQGQRCAKRKAGR
jgi:hypothetical protein